MNKARLALTLLFIMAVTALHACQTSGRETITDSQIRSNVPDRDDFDRIFKRDLEAYFAEPGRKITVDYELLRATPTQVAVASPKFYAWVKVYDKGALLEEGAVRVGAVEKKEFVVIQYMTREDIARDPDKMRYLFPKSAAEKIMLKMNN